MSIPDRHELLTGRQLEVMAWLAEWGIGVVSNANDPAQHHVASVTVKALVERGLAERDGKAAALTDAGHAALAANRGHIPTPKAPEPYPVDPEIIARAHAQANADVDKAIEELQQLVDEWENATEPDGSIDVRRRYIDRPFALARLETMRATRAADTAHHPKENP